MAASDAAIVLVGGRGTRLQSVISDVPKPLAPVAGRPFLAWLLDALADQGLKHVVLATGYLGEQIESACGSSWRTMSLAYSHEPEPLGTGGALVLAQQRLARDAFFVLNGDTWVRFDYAAFGATVVRCGARLGIVLSRVSNVARYGAARLDGDRVTGFSEKGQSGPGLINAGAYWMQRSLLADRPAGIPFSFERDVLWPAVSREPVVGYARTQGFIDIGVPEEYRRAQQLFARGPSQE